MTVNLEHIFIEFFEDIWVMVEVSLAAAWCVRFRQFSRQHQRRFGDFQKLFLVFDLGRVFLQPETFLTFAVLCIFSTLHAKQN